MTRALSHEESYQKSAKKHFEDFHNLPEECSSLPENDDLPATPRMSEETALLIRRPPLKRPPSGSDIQLAQELTPCSEKLMSPGAGERSPDRKGWLKSTAQISGRSHVIRPRHGAVLNPDGNSLGAKSPVCMNG